MATKIKYYIYYREYGKVQFEKFEGEDINSESTRSNLDVGTGELKSKDKMENIKVNFNNLELFRTLILITL